RRGAAPSHRGELERRESPRPPPGRRAPQWPPQPSHHTDVPRRRCARGDAPSSSRRASRRARLDRHRRAAGEESRLVGGLRPAPRPPRAAARRDGVDPDDVIMNPLRARERGLTSTVTFPRGNLAPEGSVIKSTAIDPTVVEADGVYRHTGPAK